MTLVLRQAPRSHCPQGHAFDERNTYYAKGRYKMCRTCARDRARARRAAGLARSPTPDPLKKRARNAINARIRLGKVERQPCEVCGSGNAHAHHEDYSKPLEVQWLCSLHHGAVHARGVA